MNSEIASMKLELKTFFLLIRDNIITIALWGVLGFLAGSLMALIPVPETYTATSSISKTTPLSYGGSTVSSYRDLLRSDRVLNSAVDFMGDAVVSRGEMSSMLSTSVNESQTIMYIRANHRDPVIAIRAANAAANAMVLNLEEMFTNAGIAVLDQARSASNNSNSGTTSLILKMGTPLLAVLCCCGYYAILAFASRKVLSVEDCSLNGELEIFGVIPLSSKDKSIEKV